MSEQLKLTKADVGNLVNNPEFTFIKGQRDYMKELLSDWLTMQKELDVRAELIEKLEKTITEFIGDWGFTTDEFETREYLNLKSAISAVEEWRGGK
jgi:regulator of sirC expression with transglutaminase-like and TPR domain